MAARHVITGNYVWWLVPVVMAVSLLNPFGPPPTKRAEAEQIMVKPVTIFDDAVILDPRKLKKPKVQTIGSMPIVLGITEVK